MERVCLNCKKKFQKPPCRIKAGRGKFCSKACFTKHYSDIHSQECTCETCGKKYRNRGVSQRGDKFCSLGCLQTYRAKRKKEIKCRKCGENFTVTFARQAEKRGYYCSSDCYWESLKHDPEELRKARNANTRKYRREHPEWNKAQKMKRHALERGIGGHFTGDEWKALKEKCSNRCQECGIEGKMTVDHIIPLARWKEWKKQNPVDYEGNSIQNIQPLCHSCNSRKWAKI